MLRKVKFKSQVLIVCRFSPFLFAYASQKSMPEYILLIESKDMVKVA